MSTSFNTKRLLISLLSFSTMLAVPQAVNAATRPTYVRVKAPSGRLSFYHRVPLTRQQRRQPAHVRVTGTQQFKVQRRVNDAGATYLQLVSRNFTGWVRQTATIALRQPATRRTPVKRSTPTTTVKTKAVRVTSKQRPRVKTTTKIPVKRPARPAVRPARTVKKTPLVTKRPTTTPTKPTRPTVTTGRKVRYPVKPVTKPTRVIPTVHRSTPSRTTPVKTPAKQPTQPTVKPVKKVTPTTPTKPTVTPTKPTPTVAKLTAAQALAKINALIAQNHFMGTMLITNNGPAGVKTFAYGDANVANKVANTTNEVYPLASLEKALTGSVVQHLINQGKLTMNTKLSQFYPQVPYANDITIRQLLDHTSGIRMGEPVPATALTNEAAEVAYTITNLKSTDQHVWSYSNANYTLLAGIIGKVTGQSFMTNLTNDVLKPLGMTHTFKYNQVPSNVLKPLSYSYRNGVSVPDNISTNLLSSELGCGNVYASVGDYYTFIHNLVNGKLDTKAGFLELSNNMTPGGYYGGIYYRAGNILRIGGADNSFHSYFLGSTDAKTAVVLFLNQSSWAAGNQVDVQIEQILSQAALI